MPSHDNIRTTEELISEGLRPKVEAFDRPHFLTATWRRGMMHAVERIDFVLAKKLRPQATLAEIRSALDELVELQRAHAPVTYAEAFCICSDDIARMRRKPGQAA